MLFKGVMKEWVKVQVYDMNFLEGHLTCHNQLDQEADRWLCNTLFASRSHPSHSLGFSQGSQGWRLSLPDNTKRGQWKLKHHTYSEINTCYIFLFRVNRSYVNVIGKSPSGKERKVNIKWTERWTELPFVFFTFACKMFAIQSSHKNMSQEVNNLKTLHHLPNSYVIHENTSVYL